MKKSDPTPPKSDRRTRPKTFDIKQNYDPPRQIARLPVEIRKELNKRLLNGEKATKLVPWLNDQPTVKKVLAQVFDDHPITEQSVSEWKKRGLVEWKNHRELQGYMSDMSGCSPELVADIEHGLFNEAMLQA